MEYHRSERILVVILRIIGVAALCAVPAIFFPYSWMNTIHAGLGLGTLPDTPIVSYLARSLSMFYAVVGSVALLVSSNIRYYHSMVTMLGTLFIIVGTTLLGIDIVSRMPGSWTTFEGPFTILMGLAVLYLHRTTARNVKANLGRRVGERTTRRRPRNREDRIVCTHFSHRDRIRRLRQTPSGTGPCRRLRKQLPHPHL